LIQAAYAQRMEMAKRLSLRNSVTSAVTAIPKSIITSEADAQRIFNQVTPNLHWPAQAVQQLQFINASNDSGNGIPLKAEFILSGSPSLSSTTVLSGALVTLSIAKSTGGLDNDLIWQSSSQPIKDFAPLNDSEYPMLQSKQAVRFRTINDPAGVVIAWRESPQIRITLTVKLLGATQQTEPQPAFLQNAKVIAKRLIK
jgi:hypothetical protein